MIVGAIAIRAIGRRIIGAIAEKAIKGVSPNSIMMAGIVDRMAAGLRLISLKGIGLVIQLRMMRRETLRDRIRGRRRR